MALHSLGKLNYAMGKFRTSMNIDIQDVLVHEKMDPWAEDNAIMTMCVCTLWTLFWLAGHKAVVGIRPEKSPREVNPLVTYAPNEKY